MLFILSILLASSLASDHFYFIEDSRNETDFKSNLYSKCSFDKKLEIPSIEGNNYYRIRCPFNKKEMVKKSVEIFSTEEPLKVTEDKISTNVIKKVSTDSLRTKVNRLQIALGYTDEFFTKQFALGSDGSVHNTSAGFDMNILRCHEKGFRGKGISVVLLDDGCQIDHEEISENINRDLIFNYSEDETLSSPHGTACAGLITAKPKNNICIAGISPEVSLGIFKILTRGIYASDEASAFMRDHERVDIYSNSWGPADDGYMLKNLESISLAAQALGVSKGRHGKGSIYTFANGNGGVDDSCGADGFSGSPYVISVQSVNEKGSIAFYGESCAHVMVSAYVGDHTSPTIRLGSRCQKTFLGTSAATPMISASVALILEANSNLTWRDVHHVVARAAKLTQSRNTIWQATPAGLYTSSSLGFGVLDVSRALHIAQNWQNVGPLCVSEFRYSRGEISPLWSDGDHYESNSDILMDESDWKKFLRKTTYVPMLMNITSEEGSIFKFNLTSTQTGTYTFPEQQGKPELKGKPCDAEIVEWLIVQMKTIHACRGALTILLTSPAGTVSVLLTSRRYDIYAGTFTHKFKVLQPMGERIAGVWKIRVIDNGICEKSYTGKLPKGYRGHVAEVAVTAFTTSSADSALTKNKDFLQTQIYGMAKQAMTSGKTLLLNDTELASAIEESLNMAYEVTMEAKK